MRMVSGRKILLLDFRKEFIDIVSSNNENEYIHEPVKGEYSIVAIDESGCAMGNLDISADCVLCPHSTPCRGFIKCENIISCGMSLKSTFCLSSANDDVSMFAVNRAICFKNEIILPYEEKLILDKRLSLYENIILHGISNLLNPTEFCKKCIMENKIPKNNCYY